MSLCEQTQRSPAPKKIEPGSRPAWRRRLSWARFDYTHDVVCRTDGLQEGRGEVIASTKEHNAKPSVHEPRIRVVARSGQTLLMRLPSVAGKGHSMRMVVCGWVNACVKWRLHHRGGRDRVVEQHVGHLETM